MTYIRDLDPQWHDPALDVPHTCPTCGFEGTVEDYCVCWDTSNLDRRGLLCITCLTVTWDEEET